MGIEIEKRFDGICFALLIASLICIGIAIGIDSINHIWAFMVLSIISLGIWILIDEMEEE